MITLDGNTYSTYQTQWSKTPIKIASMRRALTGDLLRQESNVFGTHYQHTLICTKAQVDSLLTSFAKTSPSGTPPANKLNFVDETGFNWNPATGANDSTHAYSTGVYFVRMSEPKLVTARYGYTASNRFFVDIELVAIAKGLTS